MATVLIGWELGVGLGQAVPLRDIARRLAAAGHEPVLVFRDIVDPATLFEPGEFRMLQAPAWREQGRNPDGGMRFATYADVLAAEGFRSVDAIATIVGAWDRMIELIEPDLVLANAGPALLLAAQGRIPMIALGNGFAMPPSELDYLPPLQEGVHPGVRQADLVAAINRVQMDRGGPGLRSLPALFEGDAKYVLSLPTLDPYADHRPSPADGPLAPYAEPTPLPPSDSVFAYFDPNQPNLRIVMDGLGAVGLGARLTVRGAPNSAVERFTGKNLEFLTGVPDLNEAIREASVVVHDGGLHTAATALSIGRPQLILPRGLERYLIAKRLEALGAAVTMPPQFSASQFVTVLTNAANSGRMARRALELARDLARAERHDVLSEIVENCEELLAR